MSTKKDWNAIFAERMAVRNNERSQTLIKAKSAASKIEKEPFNARKFKKIYTRINPDDVDELTVWDTLLKEAEYDYYVLYKDKMNMEALAKHMKWLQGWG